jgi:tetratricopeptide (TPR) repeat protein
MPNASLDFRADLQDLIDESREHDRDWLLQEAAIVLRDGVPFAAQMQRALDGLRSDGHDELRLEHTGRIWQRFGQELASAGLFDDARPALELALALMPEDFETLMNAGTLCFQTADLAQARTRFEAAARVRVGSAEPLGALAALAAREGRLDAARELANRALALDPDRSEAHLALARTDLAEGHAALVVKRLEPRLDKPLLSDAARVALLDLLADALDADARAEEAFDAYAERNALLSRLHTPRWTAPGVERRLAQARRIAQHAQTWRGTLPRAPDSDAQGDRLTSAHVFLLGFPRSGTTLLEKALAGHPRCLTLEETDPLGPVADVLAGPNALESLAAMPLAEAESARAAYWASVQPMLTPHDDRPVLVDKMPLNTVMLPVIARLFPDARVLLAVRDPRDVVLSCFRRRFRINAAMLEFLTLESAAAYYDAAMRIASAARDHLPMTIHLVRHETLVEDFEAQMRRTLSFVGLDWHEDVVHVAARASARAVTPSDLQLRRGLTSEGVGTWRRYHRAIAPVMPSLLPWVQAYGYESDSSL